MYQTQYPELWDMFTYKKLKRLNLRQRLKCFGKVSDYPVEKLSWFYCIWDEAQIGKRGWAVRPFPQVYGKLHLKWTRGANMVVRGLEWTLWSFLVFLGHPGGSSLKTLGLLSSVLGLKIPTLEARSFHSVNWLCHLRLQKVANTAIIYRKHLQKENIFRTEVGCSLFVNSNH